MRCKKVLERIEDHVDGLLPAPQAESIRDHLDRCRECRETSLAVNAASASLAAWNDVEPPGDGFERILARLEALPLEAFERPAARPVQRNRIARILPWFETVGAERLRWVSTSGLAAAAAVLAAVLLSRTEPHPVRRLRADPTPSVMTSDASWWKGADFDNGLRYLRDGRPTMQPVHAEFPVPVLQGSQR